MKPRAKRDPDSRPRGSESPRVYHIKLMRSVRPPDFFFDARELVERGRGMADRFAAAAPFAHAVIDDFLPPDVLAGLIAEFPQEDSGCWTKRHFDTTTQTRKLACSDEAAFGPLTRHVVSQLLSHAFLRFLEALSGDSGLITDPSHNACGLQSTGAGGKLAVHTDLDRHPVAGLTQRLNVLLYLNPDWREEYGGHLELWDRELTGARQRILPVANRLVVFRAGPHSYHGHPQPLTCPADRRRNSIALYYYGLGTQGSRADDVAWVATQPDEKQVAARRALRRWAHYFLPPAFVDFVRWVRGRTRG